MSKIRLCWQPRAYVIGVQSALNLDFDGRDPSEGIENFLLHECPDAKWNANPGERSGSEILSEFAGRACYMSFKSPRPGGAAAYFDNILDSGHGSVLEHAVWTFAVCGASRSLTHELVRHRAGWAYSQLSQRYVDESDVEFVVPPNIESDLEVWLAGRPVSIDDHGISFRNSDKIACHWVLSMFSSAWRYQKIAEEIIKRDADRLAHISVTDRRKAAREAARSVLPNATETKIVCTANARALRHFFELRGSRRADAEIRRLAVLIHSKLAPWAPTMFGDYETVPILGAPKSSDVELVLKCPERRKV